MSTVIENQIVKMQFDNSGFEKGAQESMSTLDKFKKMLHFDKVNMTPLQQAFAETEATATKAGFSIRDVWLKVASTLENQIADKIVNTGKKIFNALSLEGVTDGFKEYELKMGSIQTIMAGTGESLATVNHYLDELNTYSDKTIYSFSDMTNSIGKFTNAGVNLKDSVNAIKGIANWAAVAGATTNDASRAYYNLAQSLSGGYVKLIDWKSIENANMATKASKDLFLEVAAAYGKVTKTADGYYKVLTTNAQGKTMDDVVSGTKNFNDSLQYQWLTTDVLTKAMEIYATDVRELTSAEKRRYEESLEAQGFTHEQVLAFEQTGIQAANAATEIKTFTMLIDTLKEAIGSGWAMTWQYFIGDFEQAKALWTEAGNVLGGLINNMSEARNAFVKTGLQTGWERFTTWTGMAIPESEKFRDILLRTARAHEVLTDDQVASITSTNDLMKSFHKLNWVTGDLLAESVKDYTEILMDMTDEELESMGVTKAQVEGLKTMNHLIEIGAIDTKKAAKMMNELGGRENIIQGLKNTFEGLVGVLTPIRDAFRDVFHTMDPTKLFEMTKRFREFTEHLKVSDEAANTLKTTFKLAFGGIKTIIDAVLTSIRGLTKLVLPILNLFDAIFGLIGKVVSALTGSKGALDAADKFTAIGDKIGDKYLKIMQKLADFINKVADAIRGIPKSTVFVKIGQAAEQAKASIIEFWHSFVEMPVIQQMINDFNTSIENIKKKLEPVAASVTKSIDDMKKKVSGFFTFESLNKTLTFVYDKVKAFINLVKGFGTRIKTFFTNLKEGKSIVESFKDAFGDIIDKIKDLKENVITFFENLFKHGDEMEGKFNLEQIQEAIHNFVTNITPDQVTMIAVAGTFMLIALNLMKLSDALRNAVDSFTGIGTALKNVINSYVKKQKSTVLQIAESIVIVAAALWVLSNIPEADLTRAEHALIVVSVCLGALTLALLGVGAAFKKMSFKPEDFAKMAAGLAIISGALMAAVLSLKVLEFVKLDWGIVGKILALAAIMGVLVGVSYLLAKLDRFQKGSITLIAVAGSLFLAATALSKVASIPSDQIDVALETLSKIMIGLGVLAFGASRLGVFSAVGLIAIILTFDKIIPMIEKIVNYDYKKINTGLDKNAEIFKKLGRLLVVMTAIGALAGNRIKGAGVAMLSVAATFGILLGVSKLAGMMKPNELKNGEKFLWHMTGMLAVLELCSSKSRLGMFGGKKEGEGTKAFTRIAITMGILLGIAKLASMMKPEDIRKGELAVAGLLVLVGGIAFVAHKFQDSKGVIKSVGQVLFAITMILGMVAILSVIPMKKMGPTLVAVLAIIGALALLAGAIAKNYKVYDKAGQKVTGMAGIIGALVVIALLAGVMLQLSQQNPKQVLAAAGALAGVIAAVALFSYAFAKVNIPPSNGGQLQTFVSAILMMAIAGAVIGLLSNYMSKYKITPSTMLSTAGAIAIVLAGLTPVLWAMSKFDKGGMDLKTAGATILAALGVLAGVATSIGLLSHFGKDNMSMLAAAGAISIALIAISFPIAILGAVGEKAKDVDLKSMAVVIGGALLALAGVAAAIWALSNYGNPDTLISSAVALSRAMIGICAPIAVLGVIGKFCKTANPVVMGTAVVGAVGALWAICYILSDFSKNIDLASIEVLNAAIPVLTASMIGVILMAAAIAGVGMIPGNITAGATAMVTAIGVFAIILGAIGLLGAALNQDVLPVRESLETGLDFLVVIGSKLGEAIGAIIDGFGMGATAHLDTISDRLVTFSLKMRMFSANMAGVNEKVLTGCTNIASAVVKLTGASVIDGLASWLGFDSFDSLDFESLGKAVVKFAEAVQDLPYSSVTKAAVCTDMLSKLSEVSEVYKKNDGLFTALFVNKDKAQQFGESLANFGASLSVFCTDIAAITEDAPAKAEIVASVAKHMVDLATTLNPKGGVFQVFTGEKDLGSFGTELTSFVEGLTGFCGALAELSEACPNYPDLIKTCADATQPMVELASGLDGFGVSAKSILSGERRLDKFGDTLTPFAEGLKTFVAKISYMNSHEANWKQLISDVATTSTDLVVLANSLENMGGLESIFTGDNTLDRFGKSLVSYSSYLYTFVLNLENVDTSKVTEATAVIVDIVDAANAANGIHDESFKALNTALKTMSELPLKKIAKAWDDGTPTITTSIDNCYIAILNKMNTRTTTDVPSYEAYGKRLVQAVADGITKNVHLVKNAIDTMITSVKTHLNTEITESKFSSYGITISKGIASGIEEGGKDAKTAASNLAGELGNAVKSGTETKDAAEKTGEEFSNGVASGISKNSSTALRAASNITESVVNEASLIKSAIAASLDSNMDMQPTIRPVLDTSDIMKKAKSVNSLFSSEDLSTVYGISSSMTQQRANRYAQNDSKSADDNVQPTQISYVQNNYSPKALSTVEIYRQTKNQISMMKGAFANA